MRTKKTPTADATAKTAKTARKPRKVKTPEEKAAAAVKKAVQRKKKRAEKLSAVKPERVERKKAEGRPRASRKKKPVLVDITGAGAPETTESSAPTKAVPYVMKKGWVQVTVDGQPFSLDSTHPTFKKLTRALKAEQWDKVPHLISMAETLTAETGGQVKIKDGAVYYKGTEVHSSMTDRIRDLLNTGKDVKPMLLFMENTYANPHPEARRDFFDWLRDNGLPITDDGCFLAYKYVDHYLKDTHTHTVDNSPGRVIMMPYDAADDSWRTQCSSGFHICSRAYGKYGSRALAVKVNPRHVLGGEGGKIRTTQYEVIRELGDKNEELFKEEGYTALEGQVIVALKAERKELIQMLLKAPAVKRAIKAGKIAETTVKKLSYAQLSKMAQRFELVPAQELEPDRNPEEAPPVRLPLKEARLAAGLTVNQVAQHIGAEYKDVAKWETDARLDNWATDRILRAIADLKGFRNKIVSYQAENVTARPAAAGIR